jgi:hypothetical protein
MPVHDMLRASGFFFLVFFLVFFLKLGISELPQYPSIGSTKVGVLSRVDAEARKTMDTWVSMNIGYVLRKMVLSSILTMSVEL